MGKVCNVGQCQRANAEVLLFAWAQTIVGNVGVPVKVKQNDSLGEGYVSSHWIIFEMPALEDIFIFAKSSKMHPSESCVFCNDCKFTPLALELQWILLLWRWPELQEGSNEKLSPVPSPISSIPSITLSHEPQRPPQQQQQQ